jgi:O-antigen biosynthesis protein
MGTQGFRDRRTGKDATPASYFLLTPSPKGSALWLIPSFFIFWLANSHLISYSSRDHYYSLYSLFSSSSYVPCGPTMKRIRQKILSFLFALTNSSYWKLKRSGIFDPIFYLETNPDVAAQEINPLVHYLRGGWRERRSPHILFDIDYYFSQMPTGNGDETEPILHFLSEGWQEGKKPSPYFDPQEYAKQNSDLDFTKTNPLSHFIHTGCRDNQYLPPYIDRQFYLRKYPDVVASGIDPLIHYFTIGRRELRQPSLFFDVTWYLDRTPILREKAEDILKHYFLYGAAEGKSPTPIFDPAYYRAVYSDKIGTEKDPLAHYLRKGEREGLRPCSWFDPVFYRQTYLDDSSSSALAHFLSEGIWRCHYPNREVMNLPEKPVFSIIVPVYNVAAHHLNNCIRSVLYQSYPHWQLCIADDCSTSNHIRPLLEEWAEKDSRITVTFLDQNLGISGATNSAASLATGDYLGFLDNDDELVPDCLFRMVETIIATGADLIYTDEDLIGEDGRQFSAFYKPDFNPELLLCHNYVTHFVVTSKQLYDTVGGLSPDKAGAQDYDLFLKLSEQAGKIIHIPEILYHWRAGETSTSINHQQKEYADEAGRLSVAAAVERREFDAAVMHTELKFFYRTQRELYLMPLVSIVIYWDQQDQEPTAWLKNILSLTTYTNYEVLLLHDAEMEIDTLNTYLMTIDQPVKTLAVPALQGLASLYNQALQHCDGEYVAFLSSDVIITAPTWLSAMVEYCQRPDTGAVCGLLQCRNPDLAELTPLPDIQNQTAWYYSRYLQQASILLNGLQCPQNTWSVVWECCVIQKEALDQCNGFAASFFPDLFAIHDLCFQFLERGLEIYYTPYCPLDWQADARRLDQAALNESWTAEKLAFQKKWRQRLLQGDPFFNTGKLQEAHISIDDFQKWFAGSKQI